MNRFRLLACVALLVAGCSPPGSHMLGAAVEGAAIPIATVQQAPVESRAILHGTMTKKCPVAGCWFILHDLSGTIKVDTKNAGFVVVDIPLNTTLEVAGRVVTNGTERFLEATGVRY